MEAEVSYRQATALKADSETAHRNLGNVLFELNRVEEAAESLKKALELEPNFTEARSSFGLALKQLGQLRAAEKNLRQAISEKPEYAEAHYNLGVTLYGKGDSTAAKDSIEHANLLDPKVQDYSLVLEVMRAKGQSRGAESSTRHGESVEHYAESSKKVWRLNKPVEPDLLQSIYKLHSVNLEKADDPSYGKIKGSGYTLFQDTGHIPIFSHFSQELHHLLSRSLGSGIFIADSFFSIFGAGSGTEKHNHIVSIDKDPILELAKQKYSLVYYLSVGDQSCSEPGILKFYGPDEEILPNAGLVTIFPASRYHSSAYNGKEDRVIVGLNFYCL